MTEPAAELDVTRFGFVWGPMRIERMMERPDGGVWVRISCADRSTNARNLTYIDVNVSPKGRKIRVFNRAGELTPAAASTPTEGEPE